MQLLTNTDHYCTTVGQFSPPTGLQFSNIDYSLRELTFSWSPVAPNCPGIHYNILASNCGSCPTTTNFTTITCTDVPTNGSTCTFAVQTVVCGNITGDTSDPIGIVLYATEPTISTPTGIIHPTDNQAIHNSDTTETQGMHNSAVNTVYIISFSSVATVLTISLVVFITVIVILKRRKAKTTTAFIQSNRAEGTEHNEPMYENVTGPLPSVSVIHTQDNAAYGYIKTSTTAM